MVGGENPFPHGYSLLPKDRIVHVHTKDCHMEGHKPIWGPLVRKRSRNEARVERPADQCTSKCHH
jgi:hypothetical protein